MTPQLGWIKEKDCSNENEIIDIIVEKQNDRMARGWVAEESWAVVQQGVV